MISVKKSFLIGLLICTSLFSATYAEQLAVSTGFPSFRQDVWLVAEGYPLPPTKTNTAYCATDESASKLVELLKGTRPDWKIDIIYAPPTKGPYGPYKYTSIDTNGNVPWLKFSDGTMINAGMISTFWINYGPYKDQALAAAVRDIDATLKDPATKGK